MYENQNDVIQFVNILSLVLHSNIVMFCASCDTVILFIDFDFRNWWSLRIPITGKKTKIRGIYNRPFVTFLC